MAKCIYICSKSKLSESTGEKLFSICKNIEPDNISPPDPEVHINDKIAYGIMNPTNSLLKNENSLVMGHIINNANNWQKPLNKLPEGSYALFREDNNYVEIATDAVASRTIWYYFDDTIFISATSQIAIIYYLGNFQFDERIIPWMLATGSLGPYAWDKRIKSVPPDSSVILNRDSWSIKTNLGSIEFELDPKSDKEHEKELKKTLETTFNSLSLDYSKWVLPISGGYDSRGILCLLKGIINHQNDLKTITWGLKKSQLEKGNDAYVAKKLTSALNIDHTFYQTNISNEPIEKLLNRFIICGEGRIDAISGYTDGFKIWKTLYDNGVQGVIRGDEGFGCIPVFKPEKVRNNMGCNLCSDIPNLKNYRTMGFIEQKFPVHLERKEDESIDIWRDRLNHQYELPNIMSALSDLKLCYVELINPLLAKSILTKVRSLPEHLRSDKYLFKQVVKSLSPKIEFAKYDAIDSKNDILKHKDIVKILVDTLNSKSASEIIPKEFLNYIIGGLNSSDHNNSSRIQIRKLIKKIIPRSLLIAVWNRVSLLSSIDVNVLAFRVYLIIKMHTLLSKKHLFDQGSNNMDSNLINEYNNTTK